MIAGGRPINYLRISVTDRCNFRCLYCVPSKKFSVIAHDRIARYEEILRIARLASDMGITKVRITGGEPFVRKGIFSFLERLCTIDGLRDISITTNGSQLNPQRIQTLREMGITRLNFSLDTLDPAGFKRITGRDRFNNVWNAVLAAHEAGMEPIKINAVALRGINDGEIPKLAGLTLKYPFHVRFIEYMPMGKSDVENGHQILTDEIREKIESAHGRLMPVPRDADDGPAKKFQLEGAPGVVGFITPISSHFCSECNRLRLTSRGTLRPCLLNDYEKDILGPLRAGASDTDLAEIIRAALVKKPKDHHLEAGKPDEIPVSHMTSIGG
ncbi:GTP 3',8-cyclase MoaA [Desulfospira joergensenii]|uniref:GTP 3',8-cyclase MoaA n=1 Tax=Desulfospira joergensenii TaxID=53329 RepID=UPI0003B7BA97|nr:GTP 3',8-cyclase MoaA [Desulfospira joergensenii]